MIKKVFILFSLIIAISCNSENAGDCFQTAGTIVKEEITVPNFDKVLVHERIELFITQGDEQQVIIESGENLIGDISAEVVNNELILRNNNTCNFVRPYDLTKVHITSPNLTKIRNASEYNITSIGKLSYPSLYLMSVGDKTDYLPIGDWHLTIENQNLRIWSNGIAVFYITGTTNNLDLNFSNGDTRFEGQTFICKNINLSQVSSNDMLIFPTESLTGSIHSTGDVISFNQPPTVEVDIETSFGKLIFN